jgi:hypothetical protein
VANDRAFEALEVRCDLREFRHRRPALELAPQWALDLALDLAQAVAVRLALQCAKGGSPDFAR